MLLAATISLSSPKPMPSTKASSLFSFFASIGIVSVTMTGTAIADLGPILLSKLSRSWPLRNLE